MTTYRRFNALVLLNNLRRPITRSSAIWQFENPAFSASKHVKGPCGPSVWILWNRLPRCSCSVNQKSRLYELVLQIREASNDNNRPTNGRNKRDGLRWGAWLSGPGPPGILVLKVTNSRSSFVKSPKFPFIINDLGYLLANTFIIARKLPKLTHFYKLHKTQYSL